MAAPNNTKTPAKQAIASNPPAQFTHTISPNPNGVSGPTIDSIEALKNLGSAVHGDVKNACGHGASSVEEHINLVSAIKPASDIMVDGKPLYGESHGILHVDVNFSCPSGLPTSFPKTKVVTITK